MPSKLGHVIENNLTKGLITYSTGLNFPENAVTATNNFTYRPWGLVERRLGLDFEQGGFNTNCFSRGKAVSSFLWKDVAGDGNLNILALQTGQFLQFFTIDLTLTVSEFLSTVDLSPYQTQADSIAGWTTMECQYAAGNGFLFVVNPFLTPIAFSYDPANGQLSGSPISITIRDFDGVPEASTLVSARPVTLSGPHAYNLLNQGWTLTGHGDIPAGATDTTTTFFSQLAVYPSNSDIWFTFKDSTNVFSPTSTVANVIPGNTLAPRGHFVLNAFSQDRSAAYGGLPVDTITSSFNQPTTVAFFAGRVWFSGVRWPGFSQNIYFSQIISTVGAGEPQFTINGLTFNQFGACIQQNDPTSEQLFDLLPDDGGVIRIPDLGTVYKLFPIQNALIVFASNGIWVISGSSGVGFTADSFTVNKLSAIRCLSGTSFVDVLGYPMWWTHEGIYALTVDTTANVSSGGLKIQSLTDQTIGGPGSNAFFRTIPGLSKTFARGIYNPLNYTVNWLYNSQTPASTDAEFTYDSILIFNTLSNAWYTWSIPIDKVQLRGLYLHPSNVSTVDNLRIKYINSVNNIDGVTALFRFADEVDPNYLDWFSFDGVGESYTSSLTAGFKLLGEADKRFQNLYLTLYFLNQSPDASNPAEPGTVVSSALVQGRWDYALNSLTSRFTTSELCKVTNDSFQTGIRKIKIRGRGRVFQLNLTSDPGFPCNIEGWAMAERINATP